MQDNVTQGWVIMKCPICGAAKGERCKDSMGHNHPSSHPERFVHSAHLAPTAAQSEAVQKLAEALEWYADGMCEGWCEGKDTKACGHIGGENCAGCPAVVALATYHESQT